MVMNPLYSISEIRTIEETAITSLPPGMLMHRAGEAATKLALTLLDQNSANAPVLILAGPGNNGGDALEVAAQLANHGLKVSVLLYAQPEKQSDDARQALHRAKISPARFLEVLAIKAVIPRIQAVDWALIIDGLFGIGLKSAIEGDLKTLVEAINQLDKITLALDTPSGLDADTGRIVGEQGVAIRAQHTITFIANKPGLHTSHGRDCAGEVTVAHLGVTANYFPPAHLWLNNAAHFSASLKPRLHQSHKGSFGNAAIVGGAPGMVGAPLLGARAALHAGAGRVFGVFLENAPAYDSVQPELMLRNASGFDLATCTLVAGPGLGQSRKAHDLLAQILNVSQPIVLDADALNLIATEAPLQEKVKRRRDATILTPHPLEAARLLQKSTQEVQSNRIDAAKQLAEKNNAITILKGSGSIIATPDGRGFINPTGNPALASAGTGDVLAGVVGALLAQSWPPLHAALAATWLHGAAADNLAEQRHGPIGLTASELPVAIREVLNALITAKRRPT